MSIVTKPAEGTDAAPIEAKVAVKLKIKIYKWLLFKSKINIQIKPYLVTIRSTKERDLPFNWAINITAVASNKAVPSMLTWIKNFYLVIEKLFNKIFLKHTCCTNW